MATFYNQATLSYNGGTTNSNVTVGELVEVLSVTKTAITPTYTAGSSVVYAISLVNSGPSALNDLTVSDDLGAFPFTTGTLTPLTYTEGSLRLFVDGVAVDSPTVNAGPPLTISGINLPAGANAFIIYEVSANSFAPLAADSNSVNTVTVTGSGITEPVTDNAVITTDSAPSLTITKSICPEVITDNGVLTYTFIIQNTSGSEATAEANISVTDIFTPVLNNISVTLDGAAFPATSYTYNETTGAFSTTPGQITVPAATFTQGASGEIISTPGVTVLKISGTV